MKITELHKNFILLHEFEHGEKPKRWVCDQESYVGNYHDDWNSLMPLVQKCFDTPFGDKFEEWKEMNKKLCVALCAVLIEEVYKEVVTIVKWYKKNKSAN